jgi:predicted enzyme related to lactoylglutathione lyase
MQNMSQPSAHRHHAIDYVELTVTDLEQAKRFYTEAFGWQFNDYGPEYAGIHSPQGESAPEVGGLRTGQEVRAGGPFVLLYSTDLNRSVEAVENAGGQVVNGPYEFPGGRRFHFTVTGDSPSMQGYVPGPDPPGLPWQGGCRAVVVVVRWRQERAGNPRARRLGRWPPVRQ